MKRITVLAAAALVALTAFAASNLALAQDGPYPSRAIKIISGYTPGGNNDIMARIVAQKLNESWGQAVIVDNRPGAGGNLAAGLVAKSTADGYTFMNISTAHAISQTLYAKLDYSLYNSQAALPEPARLPQYQAAIDANNAIAVETEGDEPCPGGCLMGPADGGDERLDAENQNGQGPRRG